MTLSKFARWLAVAFTVIAVVAAPSQLSADEPDSSSARPAGQTELTIWTPAPGRRLSDPRGTALVRKGRAGTACTVSGAYALYRYCPPNVYRWSGGPNPRVYFLDHTRSSWQVKASVRKWNESSSVVAAYRRHTAGCPAVNRCVNVYGGNYGPTGWAARTDLRFYGSWIVSATVSLNDYYATDATDRRATSCHETGHALGLDHNAYRSSCMFWQVDGHVTPYPGMGDWSMLHQIY
ncbi:matrixin family metalloprotease [Nocardioides speluncae]|uniref:matrixin family metalloprotease n=1 Tax=Nocardioides speluncae TaxID=2670337 RepID=UPI000D69C3FC|nr:matrixin family metalloprotease [Nocardioides speluncae]